MNSQKISYAKKQPRCACAPYIFTVTQKLPPCNPCIMNHSHHLQPQDKAAFCAGSALFSRSASKNVHTVTNLPILKIPFVYSRVFAVTPRNPAPPRLPSFDFTVRRCKNPPHLNCLFLFLHLTRIWIRPPLVLLLPPPFPLMPRWH